MYFNIDAFAGDYAMHCKTEKEAIDFCIYLQKHGRCWNTGDLYTDTSMWNRLGSDTVYYFNEGVFGNICSAKEAGYTILEWEDFMNSNTFTKADLQTGDVILSRNKKTQIYNGELGMFITKNGWNDLDEIRNDLTSKNGVYFDIMAIRRPVTKSDCIFGAFEEGYERGVLVYQRKEVEEMTLEEVCKLLGKEIKIIPG